LPRLIGSSPQRRESRLMPASALVGLMLSLIGMCIGSREECSAREAAQALLSLNLSISFALDSAELLPDARTKLDGLARALKDRRLDGFTFTVEGFTDASGSAAHNDVLSGQRANAVADFLVSLGIERSRISARGMGETHPVAADPFDPVNRRVEMRIARTGNPSL
jgi:OOP family OmpA-OmpF porin